MADAKKSSGRGSGMNVDVKLVRELADMLGDTGLTEIEVEDGERKIRVARGGVVAAAGMAPPPAAPAPVAAAPAPAPAADNAAASDHADAMKSPMVGTVYLSAEPGGPPFKKIGDGVKQGETLLIVEAMKVMNPITADRDGTLKEMLVENAQPVEFDQPLLVIG
ncbi:MAG: acetyl-CoA carboxylase biotin carboxyl carrier protein [Alteripontixanthobacter sp.]